MQISVEVKNKIATNVGDVEIVCGNSDYVISFTFDDEWSAYPIKTARCIYRRENETKYQDVVFEGAECPIPAFYDIDKVLIGVYAGNVHTTVPARFTCLRSVLCGSPVPDPPSEDVYNQIMESLKELELVSIVTELPEVGVENKTYFVTKNDGSGNDLYDEYMWINGAWEYIGTKQIEIDLTDYVKNTDYASTTEAGVVKVNKSLGVNINNGNLILSEVNKDTLYGKTNRYYALTPANIDDVVKCGLTTNKKELTADEQAAARGWLGAVGATDFASQAKAGVVRVYANGYHGLKMVDGNLIIWNATNTEIDARSDLKPITAKNLDYAIKSGLANNNQEWTEEEKQGARSVIGAVGTTDYPDAADKAGVVKVNSGAYGIGVYPTNGYLYIAPASNEELDAKTHARRPIVPSNLDYAIKVGLTTNTETLTAEQKAAALAWLGVDDLVGDIETALDSIIAIQTKLIGGDAE